MPARSSAKTSVSAAAMGFAPQPEASAGLPDGESAAVLTRLEGAVAELKALAVAPMLSRAIDAVKTDDPQTGSEWALKALQKDPESGMAWYVLAVAREKAGDFANSMKAYESALRLLPEHADVANDLGRLAFRMGMKDLAEQLFRRFLAVHPDTLGTIANLATAVRDQGRAAEAIDILKDAIRRNPADPQLWNTLGTVVNEQADFATAIVFFNEAIRLDPGFAHPIYNRGNARLEMGDTDGAYEDCVAALKVVRSEDDRLMMEMARATIQLCQGKLGEGWDDYEARLHPQFTGATAFLIDRPQWTPQSDIRGKRLLVMGEQGLGDEVLFANVLEDVAAALGPEGQMTLVVEARLVPLFQRSFPTAEVYPHVTFRHLGRTFRSAPALGDVSRFDLWTPMASLLRRFRRGLADFPQRERFLVADSRRVAHWRSVLQEAPAGRKVGLLWKSMKIDSARARYYSPFQLWSPVLETPGVSFVNVQYGDCAPEIEWARRELGVTVWTPPGIDLKQDLDDLAALTCALDLTLGFANATSNIAAACGAPTWMISVPGAWTRLGTDRMPWYPQMRVFTPAALDRWEEAMIDVARALAGA